MLHKELLKKYKVLRMLHRGFGGTVWLAEHVGLSGRRVIKEIAHSHPWYDALVKEARILQQCRHSSIPIIYDILEFDTQTYIVEEFIEGENLKQYILRRKSLSDSLLLDYSTQICEILQYIHHPARNILHLDLKPENLLLSNHRVKLVDFGSAICRTQQTDSSVLFGTRRFCAPEQKSAGEVTEETDIYSLGKCMEYMLNHTEKIPKGYREIVENCLRRGTKRYRKAEQVKKDLEQLKTVKKREQPKEIWLSVSCAVSGQDGNLFAVMLARYLTKRYREQVLYLDCTGTGMAEQLRKETSGFVTEQDGVVIAGGVAPEEINGFCDRGYTYIVCDFGNGNPVYANRLFYRNFLVGPMTKWTEQCWRNRIEELHGESKPVLVLTGGDTKLGKQLFGKIGRVRKQALYFRNFGERCHLSRRIVRLLRKM